MKQTLQSRHIPEISDRLVDGSLPAGAFPETKSFLHTSYVEKAISAQNIHPLLAIKTPDVDKSAADLPRQHRSTLSQMRSGHCLKLRAYQHRIGIADTPTCPHCDTSDESVHHIFNCSSQPTNLSIIDLWRQPVRVAQHLSGHPSFNLAPLLPPLPRPPPEPPP